MFCQNCGKEIGDNAYVCVHCGVKVPGTIIVREKAPAIPGSGLGIVSLIMGILSIVCCGGCGVFAIVGLVTGLISRKKAKEVGQTNPNATAGIVCSFITLAITALLLLLYLLYILLIVGLGVGAASSSISY